MPEDFIDPKHSFGDELAVVANGTQQVGYRGICMPKNYPITQEYYFIVFALDTMISLDEKEKSKKAVFEKIKGHELASGVLMGRYAKEREIVPLFGR